MTVEKKQSTIPLTDYMFSKASLAGIPFSGTFELSPACNFDCRMCYIRKTEDEIRKAPREMLTLEQWIQIAKEAREAGMLYLLLTGGEPFLWDGFWELYEELIKTGFFVSINTNGSLIDEKAVERLKKLPPRRVNITLYGASDKTYEALCRTPMGFSKADRAITALKAAGIQVKLNCSLTPYNAGDLEKMIGYAKEKGLVFQIADYMFPPVRRDVSMVGKNKRFTPSEAAFYRLKAFRLQNGEEMYRKYLLSIREGSIPPPGLDENCTDPIDGKVRCRAGKAAFWVTWDGWMIPCGMMTEAKVEMKNRVFADAWKELMETSRRMTLSGVCGKCPNMELCHSCAAMALAETGRFSGIPVYLCEMVQEIKKLADAELDKNYC